MKKLGDVPRGKWELEVIGVIGSGLEAIFVLANKPSQTCSSAMVK